MAVYEVGPLSDDGPARVLQMAEEPQRTTPVAKPRPRPRTRQSLRRPPEPNSHGKEDSDDDDDEWPDLCDITITTIPPVPTPRRSNSVSLNPEAEPFRQPVPPPRQGHSLMCLSQEPRPGTSVNDPPVALDAAPLSAPQPHMGPQIAPPMPCHPLIPRGPLAQSMLPENRQETDDHRSTMGSRSPTESDSLIKDQS